MDSPPRLRGASRVVGGIARGCALGNFFNLADASDAALDDLGPTMGKVYLYFCNVDPGQLDLASVKPSGTINCAISPTVGPILKRVARKFSPIRGECSVYDVINFNCSLDVERHIYTLEQDSWNLKGQFDIAEEEEEDISWDLDR